MDTPHLRIPVALRVEHLWGRLVFLIGPGSLLWCTPSVEHPSRSRHTGVSGNAWTSLPHRTGQWEEAAVSNPGDPCAWSSLELSEHGIISLGARKPLYL